jgi:hypothetical protein
MKSMQAAGWTVVSYGPAERLRALFGRRRPVARGAMSETEVLARVRLPRPVQGWSR